jgi:hypothetical protein
MIEALVAASVMVLLLAWVLLPTGRAIGRVATDLARHYRAARAADRLAEALLREVLTDEERGRLRDRSYLDVQSPSRPGRTYRVPRDGGIVLMRERGRVVGGLCVQSVQPIPRADTVAMHKLMIEGAEDQYLQTANHLSVGTIRRYGLGVLAD